MCVLQIFFSQPVVFHIILIVTELKFVFPNKSSIREGTYVYYMETHIGRCTIANNSDELDFSILRNSLEDLLQYASHFMLVYWVR